MSQSVRSWLREQNRLTKNMSIKELSSTYCFRDPLRPIKNNHDIIFSPSDGVIVDFATVTSSQDCIFGKYGNISLKEISYGMIPEGAYEVVSIFFDILRCPYYKNAYKWCCQEIETSTLFRRKPSYVKSRKRYNEQ